MASSILQRFWLKPVSYGALTQLWAATMPEADNHNGSVRVTIFTASVHS